MPNTTLHRRQQSSMVGAESSRLARGEGIRSTMLVRAVWIVPFLLWASAAVTAQGRVVAQPVDRLTDFQALQTVAYIVMTTAGEQLHGHVDVSDGFVRVSGTNVPEARISEIRQIIPRSRRAATILGVVAGAALSLPLSISRRGDMVIPGALAGAFAARGLVRPREVVVFKRREPPSSD